MTSRPEFPSIPGQAGLATLAQLHAAGWTPAATRHARATIWQEPLPRVVAPHRGPIDGATMSVASWLWAGERAVLTGGMALAWHGLTVPNLRQQTFLLPWSGRPKELGQRKVVRTSRPIEPIRKFGIVPTVHGPRALVDAALYEQHADDDLEHLAISLLQKGQSTVEALEQELHVRPGSKVDPIWRGLEAFTKGAWSRPEKALRTEIEGAGGFPELLTNCALESIDDGSLVGIADGYIKAASTVIQVHSRQFHQGVDDQGGDRWARTVEKDADYAAVGLRVVGVSPWTLYRQPPRFIAKLRKVVELGLKGPPARVRVRR